MPNDIEQLQQRILELETRLNRLENTDAIPPEVVRAFMLIATDRHLNVIDSTKTVASETQAVDEAGSSTYNVQQVPDKYIKLGTLHIPAYTS